MKAVSYVRVSTADQVDGFSLDAQVRSFHEFCTSRGWEPVKVYREEGISAASDDISKRPVFQKLLNDATRGMFDVVAVHMLDRWSRNLTVLLNSIKTLGESQVGLVSITEDFDHSTPQGRLMLQMLGSFAEFFSGNLSKHTRKGIGERARSGQLLGSLPFGYEPCWRKENGEKVRTCDPEHPGGLHLRDDEAKAVKEIFAKYATGIVSTGDMADYLNSRGFRTRNTKKLRDGSGKEIPGPKYFTASSVKGLLKNPTYYGKVRHRKELYDGLHEPVVSKEVFDVVQMTLRKNSGRSRTLSSRNKRTYLLQGVVRCAYCLLPMTSQTINNRYAAYREHRNSRSISACPSAGGSIHCKIVDEQVESVVRALVLPEDWKARIVKAISVKSEKRDLEVKRKDLLERQRRLGKVFTDGVIEESDYQLQRHRITEQLESLADPGMDTAKEAGLLIENLPELWEGATLEEKHRLVRVMFDAVFVDHKIEKSIVCIRPKTAFRLIFQNIKTRKGSGVFLTLMDDEQIAEMKKTPHLEDEGHLCAWWRRGRVELPVQKTPRLRCTTGLAVL